MELKELLSGGLADIKVEWEGEVVQVTYLKNAYTPQLEAEVLTDTSAAGGAALADLLSKLVANWDIVQDGTPFDPTRENMAVLPVAFLVQVMRAISEAMASDPLLSGTSDGPS